MAKDANRERNEDVNKAVGDTVLTGHARNEQRRVRRQQALAFRLAGMTYAQIGERLKISAKTAQNLVSTTLNETENHNANEMRELENQRLDRAQAAIWPEVLKGDLKAINSYMKISSARAKLNGLDAPQKIDISMSVRHEMESAFNELEELVLEAEVVEDHNQTTKELESIVDKPDDETEDITTEDDTIDAEEIDYADVR